MDGVLAGAAVVSALAAIASAVWAWRSHNVALAAEHRAERPGITLERVPGKDPQLWLRSDTDLDRVRVTAARDQTWPGDAQAINLAAPGSGQPGQFVELVGVLAGDARIIAVVGAESPLYGMTLRLRCECQTDGRQPWNVVASVRLPPDHGQW